MHTPTLAPAHLLVIDDEPRILNFVGRGLRAQGYVVATAEDPLEGLRLAVEGRYDLVVLDLLMPGLDGVSLLRQLLDRKPGQAVIVLSAIAEPSSKVECLELGAEDYLAKPFSLDELLARIRARLRRPTDSAATSIDASGLRLDLIRREADAGTGAVALSEREFLLLRELMANAGQVMSKERLLSSVWGFFFDTGSNVIDVYVARLRRKLGPEAIETVRGKGYRIDVA
jgi:DNA-binding response OmpR family regulator